MCSFYYAWNVLFFCAALPAGSQQEMESPLQTIQLVVSFTEESQNGSFPNPSLPIAHPLWSPSRESQKRFISETCPAHRRIASWGLIWLWVKNRVTPKFVALANGNMDSNLRSNSWWLNFDPHPSLALGRFSSSLPGSEPARRLEAAAPAQHAPRPTLVRPHVLRLRMVRTRGNPRKNGGFPVVSISNQPQTGYPQKTHTHTSDYAVYSFGGDPRTELDAGSLCRNDPLRMATIVPPCCAVTTKQK